MEKVIVLLGPTSAGKTGASLSLAKTLGAEIISSDSMQIYRHMDIGTAKPSKEERTQVRHHMIDIAEPSEEFSAGRFIEEVVPVIDSIHEKGKIPLVVGGTGLYIKAMTRGLFSGPSADWPLREELIQTEEAHRGSAYEFLMRLDPETARGIEPNDVRRTVRALEVCLIGGKMSELRKETRPLPYDFIKVGITRQREELYRLIEERVDRMFERGLVGEVRKLLSMNPARAPMQAIGYKETAAYLRGEHPLSEAVRLIKRNTKRYAKRQFTWFSKEEGIKWVDATGVFEGREILKTLLNALSGAGHDLNIVRKEVQ